MLEEAIHNVEGTVVMVSHDRFFISQTANTILALEEGELVVYDGDYRSYMEQNENTKEQVSQLVQRINAKFSPAKDDPVVVWEERDEKFFQLKDRLALLSTHKVLHEPHLG